MTVLLRNIKPDFAIAVLTPAIKIWKNISNG